VCAKYGEEGGSYVLVDEGVPCGGKMWTILGGGSLLYDRGLLDNISRQVRDEVSSLFLKDPSLDGVSLDVRYARLFDFVVN